MTHTEATELAVFSKELFTRTTDAQAAVVRDLIAPFPDVGYVRELLKRLASETTILPTPMIRAELQSELRRRGQTSEEYARRQERLSEAKAVQQRDEVDRFIADFNDDELDTLKPQALKYLGERGVLTPDAVAFVGRMNPRRSVILKNAIYEIVKPTAA